MAFSRLSPSDRELRYPFTPHSRQFFEKVPLDEALASGDVIAQSESRLLNSLGRGKYELTFTDTDLSSFFACALVASQDPILASKFSKKEAERAKKFFREEKPKDKVAIVAECFGASFQTEDSDGLANYFVPFEGYLALVSKHELAKNPVWKLARQSLGGGIIRMNDNELNDLFGDCARAAISEGVRNLRKGSLPKQLLEVKTDVIQYVPSPKPRTNKGYQYIEELLKHAAVSDGRHRIAWLILSPWTVSVKLLSDDQAIDLIQNYVTAGGNVDAGMKRFIAYNVRRARRLGLMPPTMSKLKAEHSDIYALLPKEIMTASSEGQKPGTKRTADSR